MKALRAILWSKTVCNRQSGFTVLETLIAVSILTVGLLAIAKMQVSAIWGNAMSGNTTAALTLAEEKMEDLLEKAYTHADLSGGTHEQVDINEAGRPGGPYHRVWRVQDDTPIPNTKTIIVTVRWAQDRHHVSLSCIKAL
jgi:type IV pilus assembly protein PilV